jgi:hypothetical protein
MSERGVSVGDSPAAAEHVATPQWQSFEHRMRQRRADRCIQHASAAVELGHFDEAREALAEAHGLDPLHPGLQELSLRIDILTAPPPPPPSPQVGSGAPLRLAAVACLALLMSGLAGWVAWREWPQSGLPEAETATDVYLPRDVSTDGTPSPAPADVAATGQTVAPPSAEPVPEPPSVAANPPQSAAVGSSAAPPPGASEPVATAGPEERTARADDRRATPLPIPPRATTDATETPARREEPPPTAPPPRAAPPATVNAVPAAPLPTPGVSTFPTPGVTPAAPPAPLPPAPAPPAAEVRAETADPVRPAPTAADERAAVRAALGRYEAAYSALDTAAATSVWPTVDRRSLERAFDSLSAQRVTLNICEVGVTGQTAHASCTGRATWTPKVGGGTQTQARRWTFDLRRAESGWQIVKVDSR